MNPSNEETDVGHVDRVATDQDVEVQEYFAPLPPKVQVDLTTGELPAGWEWSDD